MGGGDLNMKKSWHPLLMKNQEKVWKEEQKALSERKALRQLQKEREEERQIQELQRMGGKREERVDWMYNAPAEGSGPAPEELEQYLLGKKSVADIFKKKDEEQLAAIKAGSAPDGSAPAALHLNPAAAARDLSAKVREDPLLAIRMQEQKSYETLLRNPDKLKKLREQRGIADPKEEKRREKEQRKAGRQQRREEKEKRRLARDIGDHPSKRRRSVSPRRRSYDSESESDNTHRRDGHRSDKRYDSRPNDSHHGSSRNSRHDERTSERSRNYERDYDKRRDNHRGHPYQKSRDNDKDHDRSRDYDRSTRSDRNHRPYSRDPKPQEQRERKQVDPEEIKRREEERKALMDAKLKAMQSNAMDLESDRSSRVAKFKEEERLEAEANEKERLARGREVRPTFVREHANMAAEKGLGERLAASRKTAL